MAPKWIELVTGSLEQKREYKQQRRRMDALPEPYRAVAKAVQRYFMYSGGMVMDGDAAIRMFGDFTELWERAAADETPIHDLVGDDPVEFAEAFSQAYVGKRWIDKERARLAAAVELAERNQA